MNDKIDQAMSHNFAARIDALRFSETDFSSLDDDTLKQHYNRFEEYTETIVRFMREIDESEIIKTLGATIDLIRKHYITPIEAEMARRWRDAK